ncbi:MAG: hypothetical protein OZ921_01170 [Sorangiineae bacterium]|nr:hypothetical protein [Polyangiaceae bacterium]MEB2321095.1 hypothetical protein [Sorangiineae bacterium]
MNDSTSYVAVRYAAPPARELWALPEGNRPEPTPCYEIAACYANRRAREERLG